MQTLKLPCFHSPTSPNRQISLAAKDRWYDTIASKSLRCCKTQRKNSKRWLGYANRKSIFSSSSRASANVVLPWRSGRVSAFDADAFFAGTSAGASAGVSAGAFAGSLRPEGTGPIPGVAPFMLLKGRICEGLISLFTSAHQQGVGSITRSTSVESALHSLPKSSDSGDDGWTDENMAELEKELAGLLNVIPWTRCLHRLVSSSIRTVSTLPEAPSA